MANKQKYLLDLNNYKIIQAYGYEWKVVFEKLHGQVNWQKVWFALFTNVCSYADHLGGFAFAQPFSSILNGIVEAAIASAK
jgi:hypothetical protein